MTDLTNEQAAYLAGVIDGEGYLGIVRSAARQYTVPHFHFKATITNTKREWLGELQSWIGGRLYRVDSAKRRNRQPCYSLNLNGGEARAMLLRVQPFLRLKQRHCDVLMRYFEVAARRRLMNGKNQKTDSGVLAELEALYTELKGLNLRGLAQNWPKTPKEHRTCRMDGCTYPHVARGYCRRHYKKFVERGGPAWHERSCQRCTKPFVSKRRDAVFCSKQCSSADFYQRKRSLPSE